MAKKDLLKIAEEQVVYMLLHNGEQSKEIHERFKEGSKGIDDAFWLWRDALAKFSQNDAIVAELERMCAWGCWC